MKIPHLLLALAAAAFTTPLDAETPPVESTFFKELKPVYSDSFDQGPLNTDFWEVRQGSTWKIEDGVLTGTESPKEFQQKKIEAGDKAHAGFKPVIWLKKVPENFVVAMRVRYNAEDYTPRFPLLDLGHHIHTLTFSKDATTLTIKKDVETLAVEVPLFSLNEWHDVLLELKKGAILLSIDGKKHLFESPNIDMTGHAQIDFKGIDFGSCQIDDVRVWEGK